MTGAAIVLRLLLYDPSVRPESGIPLKILWEDFQEAPRKLTGDDFSEPAGSRVGPLPPALRRTRKLPRGVEYVRTQDHRSLKEHFVRPQIWHTEPPPEFGHLFVEKHA